MSKSRPKLFETRNFGFIIGLAVVCVIAFLNYNTTLFSWLELKNLDFLFVRPSMQGEVLQKGAEQLEQDPVRVNPDIVISAIDYSSLQKYGRWPFPRFRHADLINSFSRIQDQSQRERALFLDVLFLEQDNKAIDDALVVEAMEDSGRVYLETALSILENSAAHMPEMVDRQKILYEGKGSITDVKGEWKRMTPFMGFEPPLGPYSEVSKGYGHANYLPDDDATYRRQPLITRSTFLVEEMDASTLAAGYRVDAGSYERLAWMDYDKLYHDIPTPLTAGGIAELLKTLEASSPPQIVDDNGTEKKSYIVGRYKDYFVPAVTLSMALDYMNVKYSDVEVVLGEYILIPKPQKYDPADGEWKRFSTVVQPETIRDGVVVTPAVLKYYDEMKIPIDDNAQMLINFVGGSSSESLEGVRNFPIRSYASAADKAPSADRETWPENKNVANKIIMMGAFVKGVAQDEKTTPYGLMYGIEIHANALNTILTGRFITYAPWWLNLAIMTALCIVVVLLSSRVSALWSFLATLVLLAGMFVGNMYLFEGTSVIYDFMTPVIAMLFTFLAVVAYRAMTEERDKRQIRATFGKYVSPKVVAQLVDNPPELGGVDKELTVLFSDIRGFTTLSENMSPQELVNHLNVYLTAMTDIILEYNGTLDKYVGDEVMCFWGAPIPMVDHAVLACKCALRQMQKLAELNEQWPEQKRIRIGIGLNSGIMTVGNMGSPMRMNYTLMGDNVNLGARLEGTNKEYGTGIILSEFTYGLVKDKFIVRELDNIRVKGKNKPVLMYELVDCLEGLDPPALNDMMLAKDEEASRR